MWVGRCNAQVLNLLHEVTCCGQSGARTLTLIFWGGGRGAGVVLSFVMLGLALQKLYQAHTDRHDIQQNLNFQKERGKKIRSVN